MLRLASLFVATCLITAGLAYLLSTPASRPVSQPKPIAAVNVSHCGGAMALFVIIDADHVIRFDVKETTTFTRIGDQIKEDHAPQTPFKNALELAETAGITTNVVVPCERQDNTI